MDQAILVSSVAQIFVSEIPELVLTHQGKVKLRGGGPNDYFHETRDLFPRLQKRVSNAVMDQVGALMTGVEFRALMRGDYYPELFAALVLEIQKEGRAEPDPKIAAAAAKKEEAAAAAHLERPGEETYFNEDMRTPVSKLKLILNLNDKRKSFIYDPVFDITHKIDYEIITERLKYLLGKDGFMAWVATHTHDCQFAYRPNKPRLFQEEGAQHSTFNTWREAAWRLSWTPDKGATCPDELTEYLGCFLAAEEDRRYVMAWLRDCLFERAEPILILCGRPGAGKNIFIQKLASALVGAHNYRSASRGFNKSAFHNGVSQCRVFFLDETALTADSRDTLKDYHNGVATIERKGVDVGDPEKIWASFALANNMASKIRLEYTDRKFYAPVISEVPLLKSMGKEKVDLFIAKLENQEYLKQIASYLFYAFRPQEAIEFPKNVFFRKLCINSFPLEFRTFIHACTEMSTFSNKTLYKGRRRGIDTFELRDLIEQFETQFAEPLAELAIKGDSSWVATSKICKPKELDALAVTPTYKNGNGSTHKKSEIDEPRVSEAPT